MCQQTHCAKGYKAPWIVLSWSVNSCARVAGSLEAPCHPQEAFPTTPAKQADPLCQQRTCCRAWKMTPRALHAAPQSWLTSQVFTGREQGSFIPAGALLSGPCCLLLQTAGWARMLDLRNVQGLFQLIFPLLISARENISGCCRPRQSHQLGGHDY